MNLTLNGEQRGFSNAHTVSELLEELGLEAKKIAIELNLEIVPRSKYQETQLNDGDRIEIVQFVGGG